MLRGNLKNFILNLRKEIVEIIDDSEKLVFSVNDYALYSKKLESVERIEILNLYTEESVDLYHLAGDVHKFENGFKDVLEALKSQSEKNRLNLKEVKIVLDYRTPDELIKKLTDFF